MSDYDKLRLERDLQPNTPEGYLASPERVVGAPLDLDAVRDRLNHVKTPGFAEWDVAFDTFTQWLTAACDEIERLRAALHQIRGDKSVKYFTMAHLIAARALDGTS
jgi:hypothetical protein